jgi:phosphoribosylaminoimidazole (AIR) synthetase
MFRTFNMGVGLIVACAPHDEAQAFQLLKRAGESGAWRLGVVKAGGSGVRYVDG